MREREKRVKASLRHTECDMIFEFVLMNRTVLHCDNGLVVKAGSCTMMEVRIPAKHLVEHHTNRPPVACLGVLGAAILGLENLQQIVHGITR
jgi:hypothetical protein